MPEGSVKTFYMCFQASEHLRTLCMQNMVWSYCKKISPEWKLQVSIVSLRRVSCVCLSFPFLHCQCICLNRWSRRWRPATSSRTRRTTTHRACPNSLSAQDSVRLICQIIVILVHVSSFTLRDLSSISPLVQMVRTLTPRCCRLWATRRWRLVEIRYTNGSRKGFL